MNASRRVPKTRTQRLAHALRLMRSLKMGPKRQQFGRIVVMQSSNYDDCMYIHFICDGITCALTTVWLNMDKVDPADDMTTDAEGLDYAVSTFANLIVRHEQKIGTCSISYPHADTVAITSSGESLARVQWQVFA